MRRILSIALCAAMLLGCVFSAVMTANAAETVDEPSASTSYRDELIIETKELTNSDIKPEWKNVTSLSVKYPIFKTSDTELQAFLNESVTQKILSYMMTDSDHKYSISGDYEYDMSLDGYLSIDGIMSNRPYMGNDASTGKYSFFVDLKNKKVLSLKDLFSDSESKVYEEIALMTDKYGKIQYNENAFFSKNVLLDYDYSKAKFNLNKDTLTIIFDAYEVAAGIAGAIEIEIPVSDINLTSNINGVKTNTDRPNVDVKTPDYKKYVEDVLAPKYGYADTEDMTRVITTNDIFSNNSVQGWNKRSGILGYNIVDMNSDGENELLVFYFDGNEKINTLKMEYYTTDKTGNISLVSSDTLNTDYGYNIDYCAGGIADVNGKKYLYVETYMNTCFTNGSELDYLFYTCDDNGNLICKYKISKTDGGSTSIAYSLLTLKDDGEYDKYVLWADELFAQRNDVDIYSVCGDISRALLHGFEKIGFPSTDEITSTLLESLGYNGITAFYPFNTSGYPSYYNSITDKLFYVICAPVKGSSSGYSGETFKSTVGFSEQEPIVSEVEISGFSVEYGIGCGESIDLYPYLSYGANTEPISNPNVVFKSSNESVATIKKYENGKVVVTGVSGGTATLTAIETVTGVSSTCEVFVYNGSNFTLGEDNFNFSNTTENFYNSAFSTMIDLYNGWDSYSEWFDDFSHNYYPELSYQLSGDVFKRLINHTVNNIEAQEITDARETVWWGSCFGLCSVMNIMYKNPTVLPISKIYNNEYSDNTQVNNLPAPVKSSYTEDLVNYYNMTQYLNYYKNINIRELLKRSSSTYEENLASFVDSINDTSMPVSTSIAKMTIDNGKCKFEDGHRILLLRVKKETEEYYVIECYDPNNTTKFTELELYKKPFTKDNQTYTDYFNMSYNSGYNVVRFYLSDLNDIDRFNFFSTYQHDSEILLSDVINIAGDIRERITITANGQTIIENGQAVDDSVLGPVPTDVGAVVDSEMDSVSELTYFIDKGYADEYTVLCEDGDHYGKAEITLENHMFSITSKDKGTANFNNKTGAMNVSMDKKSDYIVRVTDNDNICNWDWFTLTVKADDSKQMDVQFTDDGVLINGDNLKGTEITVNNVYDDSTLTIEEDLTNVIIKKSGDEITATEVKQNGSTNTNTSNGTAGKSTASTAAKVSADGVTTGDVTKISVILLVLAISGVVLAVSLKRRRSN